MKVVIGVDGSKYSRWALEWIAQLPLAIPHRVVALHAIDLSALKAPVMFQPMVVGNEPFIQAEVKRLGKKAEEVAAETKRSLDFFNLQGRVMIEKGAPADIIVKRARRGDFVMVGHRGLTGLDRFMLGSVSTKVALHAPCSVLVVKQPSRPIRKILLATDGSKNSNKGLRFLLRDMRSANIEILVTHVMPFLRYSEQNEAGKALVDQCAEKLALAGYRVTPTLKLGNPADEIIKLAGRQKVDLIVAGAKGMGAIARFFLGSVSIKLMQHSPCSVLVVR
jgi:nucleotide-binding universal stress UspA family protein